MTTFAILSTYPPTQCGLATFSAALVAQLNTAPGHVRVVSLVDAYSPQAPAEVSYQLVHGRPDQLRPAARALDAADVVMVQHEFGIFGGPDGSDVLMLLRAVRAPVVVILHTVLVSPSSLQRDIVEELAARASAVVTMTRTARDRLLRNYAVDAGKVAVVPHGAPDNRVAEPRAEGRVARPRMLTWGLIGPGKGIEWGIEALAELSDLGVVYDVVGETHPKVVAHSGEGYRKGLMERAERLGVLDRVMFDDRYIATSELHGIVRGADVILLPYDSREQVTSGVLVEAVTSVRPVVSTDFPHARELLGSGAGLLVPQRDPSAIVAAVCRILTESGLAESMTAESGRLAPRLIWPAVADDYRRIAADVLQRQAIAS
jgi:glycosyltransferase involved in cell wall biosynthesis